MVTWQNIGKDYEFSVESEHPLIYLDHWALRRLSENATYGNRFLAAFEHRGSVMFSLMNVTEIARDASPQRAAEIRAFLGRLGPHWVPMTIDPMRIIDAEEAGKTPDGVHPCISAGFLLDPKFAKKLTTGPVSLAHVVDLTRGADGDTIRQESGRQEAQMVKNLQDWRDAYQKDASVLDKKYRALAFDPQKPMRPIYHGLARFTITDGFNLTENHARDLFHALSAVRCAEMVTLDAHWVGQVRKLKLPADFVNLYREADFEQFLTDLEQTPETR